MSLTDHEYDFFISYSNADTDLVSSIVESLENDYKAKCWFQEKDSKAEFIDEIMSGIENSKVFILFISEHSANSYFVLNEINHATEWRCQNEDYKIIPIIIDKTKQDVADAAYKRVRFYLGRLNILNANTFDSIDSLILKIFEQAEIDLPDRSLHKSLYHSSESENARLCAQNEILRNFSSEFFTKYTTPDSYILDIGCASGENIILRLEGIAYTALLGLDIDEKQVECATNRFGDNKNTFLKCDVMSPELDDILEDYMERNDIIGFDVIHISAVLLHLDDPLDLLRRLRRYLKKTGVLFIQDEDDGANIVYPNSKFFNRAFEIWADSEESGDRFCGRKIPSYLSAAGYKYCNLAKCGVSNTALSKDQHSALWDIYFNYHLWLAVEENMFRNPHKTAKLLNDYIAEYDTYKKAYDNGEIFIQLGFMFFLARK